MKRTSNWLAMLSFVFQILLSSTSDSQMNEKLQLRDSFLGDYTKAKVEKKVGKSKLQVWEPHIKYSKTLPPLIKEAMLTGVEKLQVEYDEIWRVEDDSMFTSSDKKKWKGQFDKTTLYWKDSKIQASTVEKFYLSDPFTAKKLPIPCHKVVSIYDRAYILNKLSTKLKQ